jgi:hypothetical protein
LSVKRIKGSFSWWSIVFAPAFNRLRFLYSHMLINQGIP